MSDYPNIPNPDPDLAKKIYFIILAFSFIWLMLIFLAPLLMNSGELSDHISSFLYIFFSKVCHQEESRSFHILGHKLGVCSRCVWIYAGFFIGTAVYPVKYKLNNVTPPSVWLLIIAVFFLICDVIFELLGIYSNTFLTRSLTGFLTGFALPLYLIPGFVKFFDEIFSFLKNKVSA